MATSKTAAKKSAKKKAVGPAWMKTLSPIIKINYNGEQVAQKEFFASRAKSLGVTEEEATAMMRAHSTGQEEFDGPAKQQKAWTALGRDWTNHVKAKEDKEKAVEAAKAATEESKVNATAAMKAAEESIGGGKIVTSMKTNIENFVAKNLAADGILYEDGVFSLKKGVKATDELIATGFQKLSTFAAGGEQMRDALSIAEAKFALMVRDVFERNDWANFFSEKPGDLLRLKQYMAVLDNASKIKIQDPDNKAERISIAEYLDRGEIPFSTARVALEAKFDDDKDENMLQKGRALSEIIKVGRNQGGSVPQVQARNIVADLKGGTTKKQLKFLYILIRDNGVVDIVGTETENKLVAAAATCQIDKGRGQWIYNMDDVPKMKDIVEPDKATLAWCAEQAKENKKEVPSEETPKKKVKVSKVIMPEEDLPGTEEEEEPEEEAGVEVSDWDLETLGEVADDAEHEQSEDAQAEITTRAEALEIDPNEYGTWVEVCTAIGEAGTDGGEEEEGEKDKEDDSWE